jgi:hypothetical protein
VLVDGDTARLSQLYSEQDKTQLKGVDLTAQANAQHEVVLEPATLERDVVVAIK